MIRVYPLDFLGQGAMLTPANPELHDLVVDFCRRELSEEVNLSHFSKVWAAREGDKILGVMGYVLKPDLAMMRAVDPQALRAMAERYNSFLADNGAKETFIHVSRREKPEQRCPDWDKVLKEWNAKASERVIVRVR